MGTGTSTFRIADRTLNRCEDGPLEVEATLFPVTVGGRTTTTSAREAQMRLARSGLTSALAKQALAALDPATLSSYARAECVRSVLTRLTPCEAFEGRTYDRATQAYDGAWLDLRALAADLQVRSAGLVLQGLYLVSLLDELAPGTTLTLENGGGGDVARLAFLKPRTVVSALGLLRARMPRVRWDEEEAVRAELARLLRDRWLTGATPLARTRHFGIEQGLSEIDMPSRGPLADLEIWTIEKQLVARDLRGALERIQLYVRARGGETAATRYLRAYFALVEGVEPPRRIAEDLLDEGRAGPPFHELELLKARAWMAAGVWTYARHFARGLVDDPKVPDAVSLGAYDIIELANSRGYGSGPPSRGPASGPPLSGSPPGSGPPSTERLPPTTERTPPPPSPPPYPGAGEGVVLASVTTAPVYMLSGNIIEPVPSSLDLPIEVDAPSSVPSPPPPVFVGPGADVEIEDPADAAPPTRASSHHYETKQGEARAAPPVFASPLPQEPRIPIDRGHMTDRPPAMSSPPPIVVMAQRRARYVPEDVASLALPPGLHDSQLNEGVVARNPGEVRIVSTRLSRSLAREYAQLYGVQLRTDAIAVEWMQRHLVTRWGNVALTGPEASWDVRRHGALLSEILARGLGAEWVDVAPTEIGYWAMFVPPRTRTWPFGRIYRFLSDGHRAKDLVSYYFDLVARGRDG